MGEIIFLCVIEAICVYMIVASLGFATSPLDNSGGAAIYPQIICVFVSIFIVVRIIQILKSRHQNTEQFHFLEMFKGNSLVFMIALFAYVILIRFTGYILTTWLFLVVIGNVFNLFADEHWGSLKSIIIRNVCYILFSFGLYYFFAEAMGILLPAGKLFI